MVAASLTLTVLARVPAGAQANGTTSTTTSSTSTTVEQSSTTSTTSTIPSSTTTSLLPPEEQPAVEPPAGPPPEISTVGAGGANATVNPADLAALPAVGDNTPTSGGAPKGLVASLAGSRPLEHRLTAAMIVHDATGANLRSATTSLVQRALVEFDAMARLDEVSGEQRQIANRAAAAKARLRRLAASAISSSGSELSAVFGANSPAEARERLTSIQSISHSAAEAAREWEASARQLDGDTTAAANEAAAATNERELAVGAAAEAVRRHNEAAAELESARVAAGIGPRTVPDIPNRVLVAYLRAAQWSAKVAPECRMTWWALAAIGRVESGHARSAAVAEDGSTYPHIVGIPLNGSRGTAVIGDSDGGTFDDDPDYDRAVGPMQFIPTTWASSGVDASGDGVADPHNIYDAAFAAARYLCAGARGMPVDTEAGFRAAAFSYNHSAAYVSTVWDGSAAYRALAAAA